MKEAAKTEKLIQGQVFCVVVTWWPLAFLHKEPKVVRSSVILAQIIFSCGISCVIELLK